MGDQVERPHQDSILQPLPDRFLRYAFPRRLLRDETLESDEDAAVNLWRNRIAQGHLLDIVLRGHTRRGGHLHCFTSTGISSAIARRSSVANFRYARAESAARWPKTSPISFNVTEARIILTARA